MAPGMNDPDTDRLAQQLAAIGRRCAALEVKDDRTADEILGYDDRGLPSAAEAARVVAERSTELNRRLQ